jgi:hypothetical protein
MPCANYAGSLVLFPLSLSLGSALSCCAASLIKSFYY